MVYKCYAYIFDALSSRPTGVFFARSPIQYVKDKEGIGGNFSSDLHFYFWLLLLMGDYHM